MDDMALSAYPQQSRAAYCGEYDEGPHATVPETYPSANTAAKRSEIEVARPSLPDARPSLPDARPPLPDARPLPNARSSSPNARSSSPNARSSLPKPRSSLAHASYSSSGGTYFSYSSSGARSSSPKPRYSFLPDARPSLPDAIRNQLSDSMPTSKAPTMALDDVPQDLIRGTRGQFERLDPSGRTSSDAVAHG